MSDNLERSGKPKRSSGISPPAARRRHGSIIALHEFVRYVEKSILKDTNDETSAGGYWQRQKTIQYDEFFKCLNSRIREEQMDGPSIEYFDYKKSPDFKLPD